MSQGYIGTKIPPPSKVRWRLCNMELQVHGLQWDDRRSAPGINPICGLTSNNKRTKWTNFTTEPQGIQTERRFEESFATWKFGIARHEHSQTTSKLPYERKKKKQKRKDRKMRNQTWQELLRFMKLSHSSTSLTMASECLDVLPLLMTCFDGCYVLSWLTNAYLSISFYPNLHNRLQKLLNQFAGGLEVFLDSEDGEVTIKEFCQGIMRLGPQSAPSTVSCTPFKTLLQRTEGASTCFGRDLHHACQRLRKMTGGRQEPISVFHSRPRNSTNIPKSLLKDVTVFSFWHVQETGINIQILPPGPRWKVAHFLMATSC